jgi:hypothetical protein
MAFRHIGDLGEFPSHGIISGLSGQIQPIGGGKPAGVGSVSTPEPRGPDCEELDERGTPEEGG